MAAFVKSSSHAGIPTREIMFFQNFSALVILLPWIFKRGMCVFVARNKALVIWRSILGLVSIYLFFLAVRMVPMVNAVLLQNTVPIFIPILAYFLLKNKISLQTAGTMIIGFIGVILVLDPGRGFLRPGDLVALSAGFISAVVTVIIGKLEDRGESVSTIMLYYLAITMLIMGLWSIDGWKMPQGILWIQLFSAGIFYAGFQVLLITSLKYATPVIIAPFIYLTVVFSGLIDWLFWKQVPSVMTVLGCIVVILGAVLSTIHRTKRGNAS